MEDRGLESSPEVRRRVLESGTFPPEFPGREHKGVEIENSVRQGPQRETYPREGRNPA